ncbi:MAG: LacI family DNA-binding transcriptional regulator [Ilumatobacteraceae bacterium]
MQALHRTSRSGTSRRAGVSTATVSNALNRPERVAAPTRAKVMRAIGETGFVPNAAASRLRALDNRSIGVLVIDVGNAFHASFAKGAQRAAEELGFMSLLCDGDREVDRSIRQIDFLEAQRVAGVLATGSSIRGIGDRLDLLTRRGVKLVLVDTPARRSDRCSVAVDDVQGGALVGRHLIDLGRRRIAFVTTDLILRPFEDRLQGMQRAIAEHPSGSAVEIVQVVVPKEDYDRGVAAADQILLRRCDAVFCINDHLALPVMHTLLSRGVRIPEDLSIVGYDDTEIAAMTAVPLTSVAQPAAAVGATAAQLLIEECMGADHVHQHVMFQPTLTVRSSSDPTRVPTPEGCP